MKNIIKDIIVIDHHRFKINVPRENVPEMIEKLVENKIKIYEVKPEEKTLEDAFLKRQGGMSLSNLVKNELIKNI